MSRVYNFSAGPAILPEAVLKQAQEEMLDWGGSGMSVMEMSHRGKEFMGIAQQAEADLARARAELGIAEVEAKNAVEVFDAGIGQRDQRRYLPEARQSGRHRRQTGVQSHRLVA